MQAIVAWTSSGVGDGASFCRATIVVTQTPIDVASVTKATTDAKIAQLGG
jgi:hypothetical protein